MQWGGSLLRSLPQWTPKPWSSATSSCIDTTSHEYKALELLVNGREDGLHPDAYTYVNLLKACCSICDIALGKMLHTDACMTGSISNAFIGNILISMYGKCGDMKDAEAVFTQMPQRDIVSWNALLSAYVREGQGYRALQLYRQMQFEDSDCDTRTFMFVLRACTILAEAEDSVNTWRGRGLTRSMCVEIVQALHATVRRRRMIQSMHISNALVNFYVKCKMFHEAQNVISTLHKRDITIWTAQLSVCVQQGEGERALQMFRRMQEEGLTPDQVVFILAIQSCITIIERAESLPIQVEARTVISLEIGKALHADAHKEAISSFPNVLNTLLNLYGKCRALQEAEEVFESTSRCDIVSWTVMLLIYIKDGQGDRVLQLYQHLQKQHVPLNDAIYMCLLQACCLTGSLEICHHLYFELVANQIDADPSVATTIIQAYGSCARMLDAQEAFEMIMYPDFVLWTACINGHCEGGNSLASLALFERLNLERITPDIIIFSSVLLACKHAGLVDEALNIYVSLTATINLRPNLQHNGILIDLLGCAGNFKQVENILEQTTMHIDSTIGLSLLGSCIKHGNLKLAEKIFGTAIDQPGLETIAFILMSNLYVEFQH
ncbi:hypothetical protein KP509_07G054600 [Ceratopteris richardii]|uniref:Pentatricopeptide repeat-containing protein n=1 Tax=Ceratopteris richardii TaxID=49495 RepID=A0A8T2UB06_CERRI|nr:hypothetical protein KP509_07G054600 [Ceratopteris richardii]